MGSKVEPYFILTAEKVVNPKEIEQIDAERLKNRLVAEPTPPITPAPSGVSANTNRADGFGLRFKRNKKRVVKYKIPVKEIRQKDSMNKRMEMIKEKLEKSRHRFNLQKNKQGGIDLKCEPISAVDEEGASTFKLDRSVSDVGPSALVKSNETNGSGNSPYVYFVVSEERLKDPAIITDKGERITSKSADKKRRVRIVEENRLKRDRKEKQSQSEKMKTLAREIGLKNSPTLTKCNESSPANKSQPSTNLIVFPGPDYETVRPQTQGHSKSSRVIHSPPPRIPPCTPANTIHSDFRVDQPTFLDADDTVPRKPFLSSPMYNGKIKGVHSLSLSNLELPNISADQRRRALGFGMMSRFEEFAYPSSKPQTSEKQRKVSFAEPLPIIRGSGFVLSTGENKDGQMGDMPLLGPRAMTMGSIMLPSEQTDKQSMCQKFLAGENAAAARTKKFGVPLPLPKIDIVSNVYDEMIIKMIQEYLQDSNTPTRQSQLARELLVHLQKHNEHMKELNVPTLDKNKIRQNKMEIAKHQKKTQKLVNDISFPVPPNTAEDLEPKVMTPIDSERKIATEEPAPVEEKEQTPREMQKSIPFVQITFKSKNDEALANQSPRPDAGLRPEDKPRSNGTDRRARDKPILSPVTPVSFQMVPPGLSKDDSFVAVSMKA